MNKVVFVALLITALFFSPKNASAQYYFFDNDYYDSPLLYEAGISVDAMNCLTDVGGKKGIGKKFFKDLNIGFTHAAFGAFFSVMYKNAVAVRLEGTFGQISANDNVLKGITDIAKQRFNRNLNFRSNITEVSALVEIHPMYIFIDWPAKDQPPPRISPYAIGGVGYYSFNPQGKLGNRYIDLQPLHTEGQGFSEYPLRADYKLTQLNIPLGAGIKYELSPLINVRGEFIYRKLFTDYLDDLSTLYIDPALFDKYLSPQKATTARALYDRQLNRIAFVNGKRGTRTNNDGYFSFNLKISVVLGRQRIKN